MCVSRKSSKDAIIKHQDKHDLINSIVFVGDVTFWNLARKQAIYSRLVSGKVEISKLKSQSSKFHNRNAQEWFENFYFTQHFFFVRSIKHNRIEHFIIVCERERKKK